MESYVSHPRCPHNVTLYLHSGCILDRDKANSQRTMIDDVHKSLIVWLPYDEHPNDDEKRSDAPANYGDPGEIHDATIELLARSRVFV